MEALMAWAMRVDIDHILTPLEPGNGQLTSRTGAKDEWDGVSNPVAWMSGCRPHRRAAAHYLRDPGGRAGHLSERRPRPVTFPEGSGIHLSSCGWRGTG
jgi:hypothetical protein